MKLSELAIHLNDFSTCKRPFDNDSVEIDSCRLFHGNESLEGGCLYIAELSKMQAIPPETAASFLFVEETYTKPFPENIHLNYCVIKVSGSLFDIFGHVSEVLSEDMRIALCMKKLFDVIAKGRGLQHLIDSARELLGHPMLVHDTSFKILAYSYDASEVLDFYQDADGDYYLNEATIVSIHGTKIFTKIRNQGSSQYIEKERPLHGTFVSLIQIEGIEVAQFAVYEAGKPFKKLDLKLFDQFSRLLSVELQMTNQFDSHRSLIPNYILADLLEREISDKEQTRKRFHSMEWSKSSSFCIMVITNRKSGSFDSKIPFLVQSLKAFIPTNHCIVYKSDLVAFLDDALIQSLCRNKNVEFIEFLESNSLYAGVSLCFSNLSESRKYYFQACKASEIGQRYDYQFCFYINCAPYIIAELIGRQYDPLDFCHPAVLQLAKEDLKNGTQFLQTLKYYLYFTNNPNEAAKTMCIHRNTLFYRINRIKQLTGLTFENAEEFSIVYLSIKLYEMIRDGKITPQSKFR